MSKRKHQYEQKEQIIGFLKSICHDAAPVSICDESIKCLYRTGLSPLIDAYADTENNSKALVENIRAMKLSTRFWFQTQLDATKKIVEQLNKSGIVPTLLKGMSVSTDVYPQPYYRGMRDIDILVDADKIDVAEESLPTLGYVQKSRHTEDFYQSMHHTMPWQHSRDGIWLEIHKKLFPEISPCYDSPVFQPAVIQSELFVDDFYGAKISRLSKEFQIVYIAAHWGESFKQVGGLFALIDVALIINKHNDRLDWNSIVAWSNTPYVSNYVYLLLMSAKRYGLLHSSAKAALCIERLKHTVGLVPRSILNAIIDNYLLQGKPFGRVLTIDNITIIWHNFLQPSAGFIKVLNLPVAILFPKEAKNKFNLLFQLSRLMALCGLRK